MSEQLVFKDCRPGLKHVIAEYWGQKWPRLERLLTTYRPELRHLRMQVNRGGGHYNTRLVLSLPTGTLSADSRSRSFHESMDGAVDKLVTELRRHKDQIRREEYRRGRQGAEFIGRQEVA